MTTQAVTWFTPAMRTTGRDAPAITTNKAQRRIVLVDLYWTRDKDPRVPLGLASLLAALRAEPLLDARSIVLPVNGQALSCRKIASRILEQTAGLPASGVDIAIGAYIWNEPRLQKLLPMLRADGFRGRIILGGPQISYVTRGLEVLYPDADVFIRGQAETALVQVARSGGRAVIRGVHYAGEADVGQQALAMIETLPSPLINGLIDLQGQQFLRWETRRGCQFKCSFCQHRQAEGKVGRVVLPASRIMDEIDLICRAGVKEVAVLDPVFNEDTGHAVRVLMRFAENGYRGRLALQCRAETIDDAFLDAAQSLDVWLEFGLQTIHKTDQHAIGRINSMEKVEQVLAKVRARAIGHEISLIFGLPEQTATSFAESVRWCLDRQVPVIKAFPLLLLRGTKLEEERAKWGLVVDNETMPEVVASNTFSRQDWGRMRSISQALRDTEERHPPLAELMALAATTDPDRARWQPDFAEDAQ